MSKVITDGKDIEVIPKLFWLTSTHNYGAAYGIFSHQTTMLIIITFVMLIVMLIYNWFHKKKTIFYSLSLGLIIGGAIGNLYDRLFLGYVRDFVKFSFFNFCGTSLVLSIVAAPIRVPQTVHQGSLFSISSPALIGANIAYI